MSTVVLGVTGCIAAYKAAELVRRMCERGWRVKVVMTAAATEFITPLTMQTLSGEPVATELFVQGAGGPLPHLSIADEADCLVVAPATANFLGKLAGGVADDLLSTTALATRAPIVVAPAMNTKMWDAETTRASVVALKERGVVIVEPETGELACGEEGVGRLADVAAIVAAVEFELTRSRALEHRRLIVTAGGTREAVDPVRYLGNRSSGRMGYALAEEAARMGADVTLVSAPTGLARPYGAEFIAAESALQMRAELDRLVGWSEDDEAPSAADALIMAAAVSDYRPASRGKTKIKKTENSMSLELVPNPDILADIGARRAEDPAMAPAVLVGFAAETLSGEDLVAEARRKLLAKRVDLVVANDVGEPGSGFEVETNRVALVDASDAVEWVGPASKRVVARAILERVGRLLERSKA